ncbi:MAG: hypothetical protein ACJ762_04410 [Solirubrobacteraceae bacterium]
MPALLKLPLRAIDLATRPSRFVLGKLLELRHSDDDEATASPAQEAPAPTPAAEAPQTAPRPTPPKRARAKKAPAASPKAARRAVRQEPTKGQAGQIRQAEHMAEQEAGGPGPGATIEVAAPWDHYDGMTEDQVLDRLTGADPTLRAMVRLYESTHGGRRQILIATDEVPTAG